LRDPPAGLTPAPRSSLYTNTANTGAVLSSSSDSLYQKYKRERERERERKENKINRNGKSKSESFTLNDLSIGPSISCSANSLYFSTVGNQFQQQQQQQLEKNKKRKRRRRRRKKKGKLFALNRFTIVSSFRALSFSLSLSLFVP